MQLRLRRIIHSEAVALLILVLASCASLDGEMTLYRNGHWDCTFDIMIDRETMELYGQSEEELEASMADQFGPAGSRYEEEGVTYTWRKVRSDDNSIVVRLDLSGEDFESLEALGASAEPTIGPNGRNAIAFKTDWDSFSEFGKAGLTLNAGKILDSNADRVSGGTAQWDNLSRGQSAVATVTGARRMSVGVTLLIVLAVIGVLAAGAVFLSASRRQPGTAAAGLQPQSVGLQVPQAAPASRRFCTSCGEPLTSGASFCMKCGARVPAPDSQGG